MQTYEQHKQVAERFEAEWLAADLTYEQACKAAWDVREATRNTLSREFLLATGTNEEA